MACPYSPETSPPEHDTHPALLNHPHTYTQANPSLTPANTLRSQQIEVVGEVPARLVADPAEIRRTFWPVFDLF